MTEYSEMYLKTEKTDRIKKIPAAVWTIKEPR